MAVADNTRKVSGPVISHSRYLAILAAIFAAVWVALAIDP